MKKKINIHIILSFFILIVLLGSCRQQVIKEKVVDTGALKEILKRGKIIATTNYNSIDYFIYKGQPLGFQMELLEAFANYLGVQLQIVVNNNLDENFKSLEDNKCDLIAIGLTVTKDRSKLVDFTDPFLQTRQVLVQRKPKGWEYMRKSVLEDSLLRNQLMLAGKTIVIQKGSSYLKRLENLSDEIGQSINIVVDGNNEVEQLIEKVASGEINYTVCDEHVGMVNQKYYPNIDIKTAISFPQNIAWAVRKGSDDLKQKINEWLEDYKSSRKFIRLYNKYFKYHRSDNLIESDYYSVKGGKISKYDDEIKKLCANQNWDWRLMASLIYQESRFNPDAVSWAGAFGLMQLMPVTARRFGVDQYSPPADQISAGILFVKWIDKQLPANITNKLERTKFILAAYNCGVGHVLDAIRLAAKYGKDPTIWTDNVEYFIVNKSNPKYLHDPVNRNGYLRGNETYNFVNQVLARYDHYRNLIEE